MADISRTNQILFTDVSKLIEEAKQRVATSVNTELSMLYWSIGRKIQSEVLNNERAEYGAKTIKKLSDQLSQAYGRGWGDKHLRHCLRVAETFDDKEIFHTLCRQLSWSHIRAFMYINDAIKREFYLEMCIYEGWSFRQLSERINFQLFELTDFRNAIAHELLKNIEESSIEDVECVFNEMIDLIDKVGKWWIINFELEVNPIEGVGEIDYERIVPGAITTIRLLVDIALGDKEESEFYYKEFIKAHK